MAGENQREADFIERCESDYVFVLIRNGLEVNLEEIAYLLLNDRNQVDYIQSLLDELMHRGLIILKGTRYALPGRGIPLFEDEPALQILCSDIEQTPVPADILAGVDSARALAKKAMLQRSQDFAASTHTYQLACRLQWDAVILGEPGATIDELRAIWPLMLRRSQENSRRRTEIIQPRDRTTWLSLPSCKKKTARKF